MTLEEIKQAAWDASECPDQTLGFIAGAKWADEHSKTSWISTEDGLPEDGQYILATGKIKSWIWHKLGIYGKDHFFNMQYWMPIPEFPEITKGGEK